MAQLDGEPRQLPAQATALFVPMNCKHRLRNDGDEDAFIVFHLGPLAPRPPMGHVDTEIEPPTRPAAAS